MFTYGTTLAIPLSLLLVNPAVYFSLDPMAPFLVTLAFRLLS